MTARQFGRRRRVVEHLYHVIQRLVLEAGRLGAGRGVVPLPGLEVRVGPLDVVPVVAPEDGVDDRNLLGVDVADAELLVAALPRVAVQGGDDFVGAELLDGVVGLVAVVVLLVEAAQVFDLEHLHLQRVRVDEFAPLVFDLVVGLPGVDLFDVLFDGRLVDALVPHHRVEHVLFLLAEDVVLDSHNTLLVLGSLTSGEHGGVHQSLGDGVEHVSGHQNVFDREVGMVAVLWFVQQVGDDIADVGDRNTVVAVLGGGLQIVVVDVDALVALHQVAPVEQQRLVDEIEPGRDLGAIEPRDDGVQRRGLDGVRGQLLVGRRLDFVPNRDGQWLLNPRL